MEGSRKKEFKSIGDAIRDLLNAYRLNNRFDETALINSWERLVGKPIARNTQSLYMKNRVLFVKFDSPALKNDFLLNKGHVLEMFKKEFGEAMISDIVLL